MQKRKRKRRIKKRAAICLFVRVWLRWFHFDIVCVPYKRTCDICRILCQWVPWSLGTIRVNSLFWYTFLLCISWIKEDTWVQSSEYLYFEFVNICCINSQFLLVFLCTDRIANSTFGIEIIGVPCLLYHCSV